jgi:nucleoside 2-deoxyribosyltransferase
MAEREEKDIAKAIADRLRKANIRFDTDKDVGGLAPDFVVYAPDGRQFIVEAKRWDFPGFTTEATRQVQLYEEAVDTSGVYLVIPALKRSMPSKGVVTLDGLIPALQAELEKTKKRSNPPERKSVERLVFAAMPFAPQYEDVFFVAMRYAAEQVGAVCDRVDRREFQGNIVEEVRRLIRRSVAVIVDLSEAKPNVLYEAGFAHALQKPCIHICSTSFDRLPFDVAQWKTTKYSPGQIHKLQKELAERLKATVG